MPPNGIRSPPQLLGWASHSGRWPPSATRVFRERAEAKRREFVDVAQSQVATGATMLSDEIGKKLETYIDRLPGGINVRPLIESSVQIALAAALEGLLRKRTRA